MLPWNPIRALFGDQIVESIMDTVWTPSRGDYSDDDSYTIRNWICWQMIENRFGARSVRITHGGQGFERAGYKQGRFPGAGSLESRIIHDEVVKWQRMVYPDVARVRREIESLTPYRFTAAKVESTEGNVVTVNFGKKEE
jgi:hypothetical protein